MTMLKWMFCFFPCLLIAQIGEDSLPYNTKESIEITINDITTILYRDQRNPMTDFWYLPGELRIERKNEGGKSRLNFSMEIKSDGPEEEATAPFYIDVHFVIRSAYSDYYLDKIKKHLVDLGYSATDPLGGESHRLINLRPIAAAVEDISFDELFSTAEWLNRAHLASQKVTLDQPFPIQLKLSHLDASILLESLLQKRIWRVARVNYGGGRHVPVYLNLAFSEIEQPFEYIVVEDQGKDKIIFSNPTEHPIHIDRLLHYSPEKEQWINVSINQRLLPFTLEMKTPDSFEIEIEGLGSQRQVLWQAQYDYANALKLYLKNNLPETYSSLTFSIATSTLNSFAKQNLQNLELEYHLTDGLGLVHQGKTVLDVSNRLEGESYSKKIYLPSFGDTRALKYRVDVEMVDAAVKHHSPWIIVEEALLSPSPFIPLEALLNCFLVDRQNRDEKKPFYALDGAYVLAEKEPEAISLIPNKMAIAKTVDGLEKVELRYAGGQLLGFVQLFTPIYPNTLSYLRSFYGDDRRFKFAKLESAEIDLEVGGVRVFNKAQIRPSGNGQLVLRFKLTGKDAQLVYDHLKSSSPDQLFNAKLNWTIEDLQLQTIYLQNHLLQFNN